jgi:ABC-type sugar transport system permease subunit
MVEKSLLKMIIDDTRNILNDTKFMKPEDWSPVAVEELKNLDNYKKIFQTQADKIDKNSEEYKNLINLFPKLFESVKKLIKNRGELDFDDTAAQEAIDGAPSVKKGEKPADGAKAAEVEEETDEKADLVTKTINATVTVFYYLTLLLLSVLGVSLATNLNVHREIPYRVLYMVYGFIFGRIVVPYVLLYRWAYLGKKPYYFSFIPLLDKPFANPTVQKMLSWLTYKAITEEVDKLRTGK